MVILKQTPVQIKIISPLLAVTGMQSLTAHHMLKLSSIAAYNSVHKYDFICISETYLDSPVKLDDRDISINGYNLIRADLPSNNKRGAVCIYYRESLAIQLIKINYLNKSLLCKVYLTTKRLHCSLILIPQPKSIGI